MEPSSLGLILLIVTSHAQIEPGHPTGLWLEEFSVPYAAFTEAGYEVVVASPQGGSAPVDPRSMPESPDAHEAKALKALESTLPLKEVLDRDYAGIFFAGGHGTMFDFPVDPSVQQVVSQAIRQDRPLALVCHGPAALVGATDASGTPVANGRQVTGFTNEEEDAVNLTEAVPFLLETRLQDQGARFVSVKKFQPHVVVDGNLITGQNPASSAGTAQALLQRIQRKNP
jgi:putative intracellular protease/amidase